MIKGCLEGIVESAKKTQNTIKMDLGPTKNIQNPQKYGFLIKKTR